MDAIQVPRELRQILWACYAQWEDEGGEPAQRAVTYKWIRARFAKKFGRSFHQSALRVLAHMGYLKRIYTTRGGNRNRRYYALLDPKKVKDALAAWGYR
ncbi:MAG: hypothetical protein HY040_25155 [Planctomycetes bacterium]|nr:hypothetical protein [Planctomycetota bacterium]